MKSGAVGFFFGGTIDTEILLFSNRILYIPPPQYFETNLNCSLGSANIVLGCHQWRIHLSYFVPPKLVKGIMTNVSCPSQQVFVFVPTPDALFLEGQSS